MLTCSQYAFSFPAQSVLFQYFLSCLTVQRHWGTEGRISMVGLLSRICQAVSLILNTEKKEEMRKGGGRKLVPQTSSFPNNNRLVQCATKQALRQTEMQNSEPLTRDDLLHSCEVVIKLHPPVMPSLSKFHRHPWSVTEQEHVKWRHTLLGITLANDSIMFHTCPTISTQWKNCRSRAYFFPRASSWGFILTSQPDSSADSNAFRSFAFRFPNNAVLIH